MKLSDEILEWANEGIAAFEPVTRSWSTRVAELEAQLAELEKERDALRGAIANAQYWLSHEPENDAKMSTHAMRFLKNALAATKGVKGE